VRSYALPVTISGMHPRSAFSLLELLVTITIIAVLVSCLLPVLAMMRETARSVGCISQLRQIGLGDLAYAADNRGLLMPNKIEWETYNASLSPTWSGSWNRPWTELMWNYLPKNGNGASQREIYTCPQAKLERMAVQWPSTYGANGSVHPFCSDYLGNQPGRPNRSLWSYTRAMQIPRPSEVISFMDASVNSVGTSTDLLLYSDTKNVPEMQESWRADCQADGASGIWRWYANQNSDTNAYLPRWRHQRNTSGGMVFCDGHAAMVGRSTTLIRNFSTAY